MIKIPAGIRQGQKIKLKGIGKDGGHGGETGDLYLKVRVRTPFLKKIKEFFVK
jgi:DnaJ-class molecular chaperone